MKTTLLIRRCAGAVLTTGALVGVAAAPAAAYPRHGGQGAVFVQTDNLSGNTVVVYDRAANGKLVHTRTYTTGGNGGQLGGSVVDDTASEGALSYDASSHELYAVNAGSNSVTAFHVSGDRLSDRTTISSGGAFPVSVAADHGLMYVLNARAGGSIQGFVLLSHGLRPLPSSDRKLGLDPNQTPEFTSTPGEVVFSPNGHQLLVTTKNGANTIDVFGLDRSGRPSSTPTLTTLAGTVPFGATFDAAGDLTVAEAGTNAVARFTLKRDGQLSDAGSVATDQMATCWIVAAGDHLYASNAGSGTVSEITDRPRKTLSVTASIPAGSGTVDAATTPDGRFLYAQGGAAGTLTAFKLGPGGNLTQVGDYVVPNAVGGEGIAAP
jgi:6-phosphogluconolactonase (cycloisomerase 2 family)